MTWHLLGYAWEGGVLLTNQWKFVEDDDHDCDAAFIYCRNTIGKKFFTRNRGWNWASVVVAVGGSCSCLESSSDANAKVIDNTDCCNLDRRTRGCPLSKIRQWVWRNWWNRYLKCRGETSQAIIWRTEYRVFWAMQCDCEAANKAGIYQHSGVDQCWVWTWTRKLTISRWDL